MNVERFVLGICGVLFAVLTIAFAGVVETTIVYESSIAKERAAVLDYERSRERLKRHFASVREDEEERDRSRERFVDFSTLIAPQKDQREDGRETDLISVQGRALNGETGSSAREPRSISKEPRRVRESVRAAPELEPDKLEPHSYEGAVAAEIHRITNEVRAARGLLPLRNDTDLAAIAEGHSANMAARDFFSHKTPGGCDMTCRYDAAGYTASTLAENIAWRRSSVLPSAEELAAHFFESWMESRAHRENMLSGDLTHEGVGVVRAGSTVYATANFAAPK